MGWDYGGRGAEDGGWVGAASRAVLTEILS